MRLFTTDTCPKCKVIKTMLDKAGMEYTLCQDIEEMEKLGIQSVPVLEVNDKLLPFAEILKYIRGELSL